MFQKLLKDGTPSKRPKGTGQFPKGTEKFLRENFGTKIWKMGRKKCFGRGSFVPFFFAGRGTRYRDGDILRTKKDVLDPKRTNRNHIIFIPIPNPITITITLTEMYF